MTSHEKTVRSGSIPSDFSHMLFQASAIESRNGRIYDHDAAALKHRVSTELKGKSASHSPR